MNSMTLVDELPTIQTLTGLDRCDHDCPSRASVKVIDKLDRELLFCGHHYHEAEEALSTFAVAVIDERHFLDKKNTETNG